MENIPFMYSFCLGEGARNRGARPKPWGHLQKRLDSLQSKEPFHASFMRKKRTEKYRNKELLYVQCSLYSVHCVLIDFFFNFY